MNNEQINEKRKIVVMGGSFNPPTIAHQKLMLAAVEALQAEMGIFVPSSHEYVKRKMNRAKHPEEVIDEDLRFQMLSKMAEEDPRLTVDNYEYHLTQKSRTYDTMVYLMEKYSDAELFFLAGGDKIDIFPRWYRIKDFLEQFHIIVTNREDYDAETALLENPFLSLYRNRFVVIDYPEGIGNISSSVVRERFRESDYETVREMLHSEVYEIMMNKSAFVINEFRGTYSFLSNFHEVPIAYKGITYQNAEAAFQAQKCLNDEERWKFAELSPIDDAALGAFNIKVCCLQKTNQNVLHIIANITGLSQCCGICNSKRNIQNFGQGLGKEGLTGTRGANQQNIAFLELYIGSAGQINTLIVIVNGNRKGYLSVFLANDILIHERLHFFRRRQVFRHIRTILILTE